MTLKSVLELLLPSKRLKIRKEFSDDALQSKRLKYGLLIGIEVFFLN